MGQDGRAAALAVVTGTGLLLGGAGAAWAGVTDTFAVQESTTPSHILNFNQFDTSLGTLNEVDILLSGSTLGDGSQISLTGGEGSGMASFTASLDVLGPASALELTGGVSASASCGAPDIYACSTSLQSPVLGTGAFQPNPVQITAAGALPAFEGAGTVGLTVGIDDWALNNTCTPYPYYPATCDPSNNLSWSGSIEISYLYTPNGAPVPEPASLLVFASGLLAFAGVRRRG